MTAVADRPTISERACRAIVAERSMGLCEVRIDVPGVCRGMGESMHHRRKAGQGGPWTPSNIVHVCGNGVIGCHGYLEANPVTAKRLGLWLYTGQDTATPAKLFFRGLTGWYVLHDSGAITWLPKELLARMKP